jgi:AraC family transcriptional regulator
VGAPGAVGVIGEFRLPARRLEIRRIDAPTVTAVIVDLERDFPVSGAWYNEAVHYFDMSLIPRAPASRGRFEGVLAQSEAYGRVFVAPAGYRLRGEGPECRQLALNVFLQARPLFPDEEELGDRLAPLLRTCLRFSSASALRVLERIAVEVAQPRFASEILVEGLGLTLLAEATRSLHERARQATGRGGLPHWRLKLIEQRVHDGEQPPSIAELAALCGLSRRQLTRAFHEETGRTISDFVEEVSVERAKRLLTETDLPIRTIGVRLGFSNPSAFACAFRRATGLSPRALRSMERASEHVARTGTRAS